MAGRTEFGGIFTVEGFEKTLFVGFRVESNEIVVQITDNGILTGGDVVKGRVFNDISAVAHRIFDLFYGVARRACKSCLCGGCVEVFTDGSIHYTVE